jgi:hypothetical protein
VDEQRITARRVQALDNTIPTLVATPRGEQSFPLVVAPERCGLHLHAHQLVAEDGYEVAVRVFEKRLVQSVGVVPKPLDR